MSSTTWKDRLPGGLADQKTPADFPAKKLEHGAEVEGEEHTSDKSMAKEIAMDHMTEMGTNYYAALDKMEDGLRKEVKTAGDLAYLLGRQAVPRRSILKSAGDAKPVYHLAGRLYLSKSNWLLLSVPNALARGAFDALDEPGVELPTRDTDDPDAVFNAHVSVMSKAEVEALGGGDRITERGHMFRYSLGPVKTVEPKTWNGVSKVWYITVNSPELRQLRKSYGLSAQPNEDWDFHITIGIRKIGILHPNEKSKAAGESCPHCQTLFERGDDGTCNHCGKPWPEKSAVHSADRLAFWEYMVAKNQEFKDSGELDQLTTSERSRLERAWEALSAAEKLKYHREAHKETQAQGGVDKVSAHKLLDQLQQIKALSDQRNYAAKHQKLQALMRQQPADWEVDQPEKHHPGVTHTTGFRYHTARNMIPPEVLARGQRSIEPNQAKVRKTAGIETVQDGQSASAGTSAVCYSTLLAMLMQVRR